MQNFNHSGNKQSQQPQQQKPAETSFLTKVLTHLDVAGSLVMIVAMFLGTFYKSDGGLYSAWVIKGYGLIFNSDYLLGTLLIILPLVVLIAKYVESLKKYDQLISLICLAITFIFVFVVKGQASTLQDGDLTLGFGAIIYLLGNVIGLIGAVAAFFGYDVNAKVNGMINKK